MEGEGWKKKREKKGTRRWIACLLLLFGSLGCLEAKMLCFLGVCVFFFVVALQVKSQKTAVLNCAAHRQSNKQTRQPKLLDDINKKLE